MRISLGTGFPWLRSKQTRLVFWGTVGEGAFCIVHHIISQCALCLKSLNELLGFLDS